MYFLRWLDNPAVLRIRIVDRKVEQVWDLANLPMQLEDKRIQDVCAPRLESALKSTERICMSMILLQPANKITHCNVASTG